MAPQRELDLGVEHAQRERRSGDQELHESHDSSSFVDNAVQESPRRPILSIIDRIVNNLIDNAPGLHRGRPDRRHRPRRDARARRLVGDPGERRAGPLAPVPPADCVVVALKSRTNRPPRRSPGRALLSTGCEPIRPSAFTLSTARPSTRPRGNIGPVADALLDALGERFTVATPAYPRNGRTVFKGNLFVGDVPRRIGDEDHPLTPMRDSNLVRVLAAQTPHEVGLVPSEVMDAGPLAIRKDSKSSGKAPVTPCSTPFATSTLSPPARHAGT